MDGGIDDLAKGPLQNLLNVLAKNLPSAAASLREGLEETPTVKWLGLKGTLERTLATINSIENLSGSPRQVGRRVRRRRGGQMVLRWIAPALPEAAQGFRHIRGFRDLPKLLTALRTPASTEKVTTLAKAG